MAGWAPATAAVVGKSVEPEAGLGFLQRMGIPDVGIMAAPVGFLLKLGMWQNTAWGADSRDQRKTGSQESGPAGGSETPASSCEAALRKSLNHVSRG